MTLKPCPVKRAAKRSAANETAHVASAGRIGGHGQVDERIVRDDGGVDKRIATARAQLAVHVGAELREIASDGGCNRWLAVEGNLLRWFDDIEELEAWVAMRIGCQARDPGRRERERRALIDEANRQHDKRNEVLDLRRGPGGEH
jgi:hypothetical protein